MAQEEKDTEKSDATQEEKETDTQETASEETTEDKGSSTEEKPDYEAIAKAEKERADALVKKMADDAYKYRRQKPETEDTEDKEDDADEKPLTTKDLKHFESRIVERTKKELDEQRALDIARQNTSSEQEAQAALVYWKNRVVPTGDLNEDVLFAIAGLNHRKTVAKAAELTRALRSKDTASHDSAATHRDAPEGDAPKLSPAAKQMYEQAGFVYDGKKRLWIKKLPSGKSLVKDPKTKRTYIAG